MVQQEVDRLIAENKQRLGDREGLEEYLNSIGKTEEEYRGEIRPMAERIVIRSLVLQQFAEQEEIEVSVADIDAEVDHLMQHTADERMRQIFDSPSARETLGRNLFIRKAIDRLYEIVTGESDSVDTISTVEESVETPAKEEEDENGNATQ
jgi:FKBP-type peptidyl-prolyl cis-trans isomerase (trigger factor)